MAGKVWKGPWVKIKCSGCNVEKSAAQERVDFLKEEGKWGKNLEKYLCRDCRKTPKAVKEVSKEEGKSEGDEYAKSNKVK